MSGMPTFGSFWKVIKKEHSIGYECIHEKKKQRELKGFWLERFVVRTSMDIKVYPR